MAMQRDIDLSNGLTVPGAYIRIDTYQGSKAECMVMVDVYASKNAYLGVGKFRRDPPLPNGWVGQDYIERVPVTFVPKWGSGGNLLAQGYAAAMKLDRFKGAAKV